MKQLLKRFLAVLLAGLICVSLTPGAALADPGEEEGSIAPAEGDAVEESGEIAPCEEPGSIEKTDALCSVSFLCDPIDTRVRIYDPTRCDEFGDDLEIKRGEDGTWLLEPGEYCFSAERQGYETVEKVPFSTEGKSELCIRLTLLPLTHVTPAWTGDDLQYPAAYPLPAMTGDSAVDTANVAQSQLGYTKNGGTVYGAWWNGVTNWGVDYTYADWCAMFACWCAYQAGAGMDVAYDKYGANANFLMNWQFEHASGDKSFSTDPKTGDFLFFGSTEGTAGHVAIVTAYDANAQRVDFVGGNQGSSSAVTRGSVSWCQDSYWGSQIVLGYGRPNYTVLGAAPIAHLEAASGGMGVIQVSGWGFDPDEPESPIKIHLCVGSPLGVAPVIYEFQAKDPWEGLEEEYPEAGPNHGFSKTISLEDRGTLTLYFYACDLVGSHPDTLFGTAEVTITTPMLLFYTITYDANGGSGAPEDQIKTHDEALTLSTVQPVREDAFESCTVTLDPNGGSVDPDSLTAARTVRYSFESWNTMADGTGSSYAPGDSYTENVGTTLYAQWNASATTAAVTLPTPSRAGHTFKGWAAEKTASEGVSGSYTPSGDVTLYAIWEADAADMCGDDLTWSLEDGVLTISGTGDMWDWSDSTKVPWYSQRETIRLAVLPSGLAGVGENAFCGCSALEELSLPATVERLGSDCFRACSCLEEIVIPATVSRLGEEAFSGCEKLAVVRFEGPAPSIGERAFFGVTATACYPEGDESWTEDAMQQYGGTITWLAYESAAKAGVIRSASANFEGKIIMNFYLTLNDEVLADPGAYVLFTGGSSDRKILVSDAKPVAVGEETRYQFTYPLVAKEIRDNINLKLYDGDGNLIRLTNLAGTNDYTESGVNYSLLTYCNKMLSSSTSTDKMKALATATIDYCTAAQIYFKYNAEGLSASEAVTSVTLDELQQYKAEFTGTLPTGVVKRTISGVFESDNSLRLYFFFAEGYDPASYQYSIDGASVSLKGIAASTEEGCAMSGYLELSNVASKNLGDLHELTITDGTNSYTVGCSVLTYARSSVANGTEARQNLGKSLYLYYLAAKNYFS